MDNTPHYKRVRVDISLTVAGETLVACVKFGVASDESMIDLPISFC